MNLRDTMALLNPTQPVADYRIEDAGATVRLLSERSAQRGSGPKPPLGTRMAFRTRRDTAEFVLAGEAAGYTFLGKELLAGISSL